MLAYIFNKDGKFELVEKERPKARKGVAVIRVLASSICGTDFRTYPVSYTHLDVYKRQRYRRAL